MFNWRDFISFSDNLIGTSRTVYVQYQEALCRSVISRSYYGVFKQVEDYLKYKEIKLSEKDDKGRRLSSHDVCINYLRSHSKKEVQRFGDLLFILKHKRIVADYKAECQVDYKEASDMLELAKGLSEKWDSIKIGFEENI